MMNVFKDLAYAIWEVLANGAPHLLTDRQYRNNISYAKGVVSKSTAHQKVQTDLIHELVSDADWVSFAELLKEWDQNRAKCPAGYSTTQFAIETFLRIIAGERYDYDCAPTAISSIPAQLVAQFETLAAAKPDHYPLAALAAQLRLHQAWDLRGGGYVDSVPEEAWAQIDTHYERATWLLEVYDPIELNSPMLAATKFRLCDHMDPHEVRTQLHTRYELWRDLDPEDMSAHEAYAFKMLPRWYGTYEELEMGLRKSAALHGSKAYAAGYLGVATNDEGALATMDAELFSEGLNELVQFRGRDTGHVARMIQAVYEMVGDCSRLGRHRQVPEHIKNNLKSTAEVLTLTNRSIAKNHLTGLDRDAWEDGITGALEYISELFQAELKSGAFFEVTEAGLQIIEPTPDARTEPL